jgi:hypothetical protein
VALTWRLGEIGLVRLGWTDRRRLILRGVQLPFMA